MEGKCAQWMKDDEHGWLKCKTKMLACYWLSREKQKMGAEVGSIVSFLKEWGWGGVWTWEYGVYVYTAGNMESSYV